MQVLLYPIENRSLQLQIINYTGALLYQGTIRKEQKRPLWDKIFSSHVFTITLKISSNIRPGLSNDTSIISFKADTS